MCVSFFGQRCHGASHRPGSRQWVRGELIGRGSLGSVWKAGALRARAEVSPRPPSMKSAKHARASSLPRTVRYLYIHIQTIVCAFMCVSLSLCGMLLCNLEQHGYDVGRPRLIRGPSESCSQMSVDRVGLASTSQEMSSQIVVWHLGATNVSMIAKGCRLVILSAQKSVGKSLHVRGRVRRVRSRDVEARSPTKCSSATCANSCRGNTRASRS